MKTVSACLFGALLVVAVMAVAGPATAEGELYYRGYFDGEVKTLGKGLGWYTYTPAPNPAYPLFEYRHTSPWWYLIGPEEEKEEDESFLNPNKDKVHTLSPLPGQYWYKKPAHYNFSTPQNSLGWPYRKYNQRYW